MANATSRRARKGTPLVSRLMGWIDPQPNGCWEWAGARDKDSGYGRIQVEGSTKYAHRVSYELLVGPIPADMQLDHLCRVRECVNPDHLEPVTPLVNTRRSPITHGTESFCPAGHPYAGANLYTHVDTDGYRRRGCRTCRKAQRAAWGARQTAA